MTKTLHSQPEPGHIAHAALALAGVLAGDLDVETRLGVGAALAILSDVHPPYPPHPATVPAIDPAAGIAVALEALATRSATVEETIRTGLAARELRQVQRAHGSQP